MPLRRAGKKMRDLPLGLAKSIYYCIYLLEINVCLVSKALVGKTVLKLLQTQREAQNS